MHDDTHSLETKLLRLPEVLERIPLSRAALYRAIREKRFPAPCKVLQGRGVAWDEREIAAYVAARLAERSQ